MIKNWYFRGLAPMETKRPEGTQLVFPAPKKRPAEALFGALENSCILEDLQCTAGTAPNNFRKFKTNAKNYHTYPLRR